ncbi:hypothetical protein ABPG75_001087 [Micractinium tetrahymenae]
MPGERFHVRLLPEEGSGAGDRVTVEVGLEGFLIHSMGGSCLRKYPLHHISRWSMRNGGGGGADRLVLYTRSPVDVEDQSVTLQGDEITIRSVLDTLTCSCMQMAEMIQSGQGPDGAGQAAANSLNALLKKSKKPALLTADQVEFWHHPEKAGWMHSQGEHIKTWRKRWFVLKQGFIFRFASNDVSSSSKPRGIVDLSTVTDVSDGSGATGRPNSIKVSTATGYICYLCENETSQVEWISALEGAVAKIVKLVAGVDDEAEAAVAAAAKPKSWAEQLERTYASVGSTSASRRGGSSGDGGGGSRSQMVSIVSYDGPSGGGGGSGARGGASARSGYGGGYSGGGGGGGSGGSDYSYVTVDYGSIAGATAVPDSAPAPASYGGGYGAGYGQQQQQQPPAAAYGYAQQQHQQQPGPEYGQQAGGYGGANLMDAVTAPQAAQQAQSGSPWQVHYTAEGRPYFFNPQTGVTQWNAPA